ncbi:MAG: hypothetical protein JKX78_03640 [Alteromonadaceae bacterium]|nr:hypothetical protein [Alteromonadaceae bacterium]MBL4909111.1 hypothetical protein [Alteromonadaceae bacterium]
METRTASRGFWIFKELRTVSVMIEHRRTTYLIEEAFKPTAPGKIITLNESAIVATFEDSEAIAAIHTLAHYNAQIHDNAMYTHYQQD